MSVWGRYNFRNGTAERNDCVSFRILQEYDNLSYEFVLYVAVR